LPFYFSTSSEALDPSGDKVKLKPRSFFLVSEFMTLIAGAFVRSDALPMDKSLAESLRRAISRTPGDRIEEFSDRGCLLLKVDIGAFDSPAVTIDEKGASFMTGHPLLKRGPGEAARRDLDLGKLHSDLVVERHEWMERARGVFSLAHYNRGRDELILVSDKLAIRPLYYSMTDDLFVFASTLGILERVPEVTKVMDAASVAEVCGFAYPLGDYTPFVGIRAMMPAEIVAVGKRSASVTNYWRWDSIPRGAQSSPEQPRLAYEAFRDAIAIRRDSTQDATAFLSGGLDSRVIAAALLDEGARLRTYNFARPGTQDQLFAAGFATVAGIAHTEAPMRAGRPAWSEMIAAAIARSQGKKRTAAGQIVWSGDGGSVVLGHVYMDEGLVGLARRGALAELASQIVIRLGGKLPRRLFRRSVAQSVFTRTNERLLTELQRHDSGDPGRDLHLFLLFNDQRRHLFQHFEDIDLHRVEFHLPFFDSNFIEAVLEAPVDECLDHKFYMQCMRHLPALTFSVPWQTYPGHEACPLPIPSTLGYQWDEAAAAEISLAKRSEILEATTSILRRNEFPFPLMHRYYVRLAQWAMQFRVRDTSHVLMTAQTFHKFWHSAGRRVAAPR
jgi:asparagine synthase (glutamine-hydrolysing)